MRLIFLDVDGVLNHHKYFKSIPVGLKYMLLHRMDMVCMDNLNKICGDTGARVVVSSTWRDGHSLDFMSGILYGNGFRGKVIGVTPRVNSEGFVHGTLNYIKLETPGRSQRGDEILAWYLTNALPSTSFESIVVIDDDSDLGIFKHRHIHTSMKTGLNRSFTNKTIDMLMSTSNMPIIHKFVESSELLSASV